MMDLTTVARIDADILIALERKRQIVEEGWTPEHDAIHTQCELADAAACYERCADWQAAHATLPSIFVNAFTVEPIGWPWSKVDFKIGSSAIRTYVKAGALYQAELDRIRATRITEKGVVLPAKKDLSSGFQTENGLERVKAKINKQLGIK